MYTSGNNNCTVKIRDKSIDLKETKDLYGRLMFLVRSSRDVDQKEAIGNSEFILTPRALFAPSGSLLPCNDKSKLIHALTNLVLKETMQTPIVPDKKIALIDGMVLVQKLSKKSPTMATMKDLSETFYERLTNLTQRYDEVIGVFGTYKPDSLKETTRQKRRQEKDPIMYQNEGFRLNFICHSIKKSIVSRLLIVIEFKFDIVDIKMNEPCQKSTGAIKKKRIFHSTQIEEEKVKHNTMTSTTQLNEKVFDIISKILPFIKLHIDEPCQPKVLGSICKLTMTVTYEACAESLSIDSADLMQHQLKQILQDITFKYNGQRMKECIEYLLADISEVVYNILAYYLLLKFSRAPSDSASLSDKIKSVLESLESECAGLDFNLHSTSNGHSSDVIISTSQDCLLEISQGDKLSSPKLPLISSNPVVESMTAYVNQAPNDADCEEVDPKPTADTSYYNQEIPNGLSDRIAADVEPEPEAEPEADISNKDLAEADQSPQSGTLQCSEREQASNEVSDADKEFQSMCNGVCSPENTEDDFGMVASGGIDLEAEETDSARCNGLSGRNAFVNSTAEVSIAEPNEALSTESQQDLLRKTSGT
ncbi:Pericentriolar material 1 protein [Nymphon striatum]|nr:Pericentriolar material 1 protein [Nymphon striatum]